MVGVIKNLRIIRVRVAVLVHDVLLHFDIFLAVCKGTMANDGAIADSLNGYQSFWPSSEQYSEAPTRLCLKFFLRRFVEKTSPRCILNRGIRRVRSGAR